MTDIDAVYLERDQVVAALSKCFPSWLGAVDDAEPGWSGAVYIELPTGQVSWHIPDHEAGTLFAHLPVNNDKKWDGHTTPEKYARLNALIAARSAAPEPDTTAFEAALDELCGGAAEAECDWLFRDWDSWEASDGTFQKSRQRLIAMFKDAAR